MDYNKDKYNGMLTHLAGLLQIPSVQGEPEEGMPFGKETYNALKYMLNLGSEMGFKVKDVDGYAGHIEWGEGDDVFGVLCHLDVVPAGDGWTYPPFSATICDGKMYARGAEDNKAPAISTLYAVKRLKDEGFVPKKKFRLILGLNEESGWKCIEYYFKKEKMPVEGFSPDSDFPVINCEKGVLHLSVAFNLSTDKIANLSGGHRVNMVPDRASYSLTGGEMKSFVGVSAHGSRPHKGKNAAWFMLEDVISTVADPVLKNIYELFCTPDSLNKLELNLKDDVSGNLTLNLGTINKKGKTIICGIDIRYPVSYEKEDILNRLAKNLPKDCSLAVGNYHKPLYVSEDEPLVKNLLAAYENVTGKKGKPISIGGATYARALDKGVAFGPVFPNEDSKIHTADENVDIEKLYMMTDIYYQALKSLL